LFKIKLSQGKLVTEAFQHMGIICGARKVFLEPSLHANIRTEAFDLQQEIQTSGSSRKPDRASGRRKKYLTMCLFVQVIKRKKREIPISTKLCKSDMARAPGNSPDGRFTVNWPSTLSKH
jgi:hypothetical protein